MGNSETQSTLKDIATFPENTVLRKISCSKGSDGHSLAIDKDGRVFSWGDGKCDILYNSYLMYNICIQVNMVD